MIEFIAGILAGYIVSAGIMYHWARAQVNEMDATEIEFRGTIND